MLGILITRRQRETFVQFEFNTYIEIIIMDSLETIKTDLRAKYLRDRDDLQRQVSSDPEQWTDEKMNEAVEKVNKKVIRISRSLSVINYSLKVIKAPWSSYITSTTLRV